MSVSHNCRRKAKWIIHKPLSISIDSEENMNKLKFFEGISHKRPQCEKKEERKNGTAS